MKTGGSFAISTLHGKNNQTAIDKALEVLDKLHQKGLDEKSLTSAKNYVKDSFLRYETGQLSSLLSQMFWYNFDKSFIDNFEKTLMVLTWSKPIKLYDKYFPKDKLQFVLVGKSEDIKKIAEKYGKVSEVEIDDDIKKEEINKLTTKREDSSSLFLLYNMFQKCFQTIELALLPDCPGQSNL
jgi:hypothetical protein